MTDSGNTNQDPAVRLPRSRSGFDSLALYEARAAECYADLSDNTNLWGMPPAAKRSLGDFDYERARGYPPAYTPRLKAALASYAGVDASMIVTGCGSDDVLDSAIRAFGNPAAVLACCDPTFSMIPVFARVNSMTSVAVPFDTSWDIQTEYLLAVRPEIIYICSPNNPTGTSASLDRIEDLARTLDGLVIVDQAYAEYTREPLTSLAVRYSNVLVTRTMSKAFGMAGLRLGYGIGNPALVREIEKSRGPYKVSAIAEAAAIAALQHDRDWVDGVVVETLSNRARLTSCLQALGFTPLASDANFILLPLNDVNAVAERLVSHGVATRPFSGVTGIGGALRVTIGPWTLMAKFLEALQASIP